MRAFTGLDQFYPYLVCLERLMQAIFFMHEYTVCYYILKVFLKKINFFNFFCFKLIFFLCF